MAPSVTTWPAPVSVVPLAWLLLPKCCTQAPWLLPGRNAQDKMVHIYCSCHWCYVWHHLPHHAQVQEKPDYPLNYLIGGCAGGLTLGVLTHNYRIRAAAAWAYMGMMVSLVKMGHLEGWKVFAEPKVWVPPPSLTLGR